MVHGVMADLTHDECAVILRVLATYRAPSLGEHTIVEAIRVKLTTPPAEVGALSVDTLRLSVRAANCLHAADLRTVGEVASKTDRELLRLKNLGVTMLKEIRAAIASMAGP